MDFMVKDDKDKFEILKDFADAQKEVKSPEKNQVNAFAHNNYADLKSVSDSAKEALGAHGMTCVQEFGDSDGQTTISVQTIILHTKGMMKFNPLIVPLEKQTAQGVGSAITYARRYALSTNMGIIADDDDDGNAASQNNNRSNKNNNYKSGNYKNNKKDFKNNNNQNNKPKNQPSTRQKLINKQNGWLRQYKQVTHDSGEAIFKKTEKDCRIKDLDKIDDKNYDQFVKFLVINLQTEMKKYKQQKA